MPLPCVLGGGFPSRITPPLASHEPAGMTQLFSWNAGTTTGWTSTSTGGVWPSGFSFTSDATEPESAPTVMAMAYGPSPFDQTTGQYVAYGTTSAGTGHTIVPDNTSRSYTPGHIFRAIQAQAWKSIYVRGQVMFDPAFKINDSDAQKLFQVWMSGTQQCILGFNGSGASTTGNFYWSPQNDNGNDLKWGGHYAVQDTPPGKVNAIQRGVWHTLEMVLVNNTGGLANGRAKWWTDGNADGDITDVSWNTDASTHSILQFDLNPIWGGGGGILTGTQYIYLGHVYASATTGYLLDALP